MAPNGQWVWGLVWGFLFGFWHLGFVFLPTLQLSSQPSCYSQSHSNSGYC